MANIAPELMKPDIAADNEGIAHGLAVYESPSLKRKAAFDGSSDTDEEKKDKSDGDCASAVASESSGEKKEADASASEGGEDDTASEGSEDDTASEGSEDDTASEGGEDAAASEGGEAAAASEGGEAAAAAAAAAKAAAKAASAESDEAYFACFETEKERNEMREYCRILEESDGFDIGQALTKKHIGGRVKIDVNDFEDALLTNCIDAIKLIIKHRNKKKGANLEFVEVTMANYTGCTHFWVTFTARNKTTEKLDTYQSQMFYNKSCSRPKVNLFRLKPSGGTTAIQA
ncbi:uncharacterized protein LOC130014462 [Mercurialis annua]|uniref:uncharacterized protein LOC130014462 n=1 Tax=Mercurialis annua TaxID=3986 RepID=UPI00215E41E9|nr:uncharacterized protein LOC130014462 [Mercurialis annua]